ncbi:cytochrome c [Ignatzschineria rhizosphaerae]|uniref:Cytochrome c n=1 Tax=Ignatzschineria rhizosphaerae TaxID=2923279 RepID=A0ABY3WZR6_9GAMM|nr:cytochrome c [Ignatzschineria rhizosphaerae]UNM95110.1 cytochrome c [Ignatzschineria rhizosphaerae]
MKKLALAAMLAVGVTGVSMAEVDADAVTYNRQAAFGVISWNMGIIGGMLKGETEFDADEAKAAAVRINEVAKGVHLTFIDGTYENSNVDPKIVTERADFDAKLANLITESDAMIGATSAKGTMGAQMGKLGGTCKSCHDAYKLD